MQFLRWPFSSNFHHKKYAWWCLVQNKSRTPLKRCQPFSLSASMKNTRRLTPIHVPSCPGLKRFSCRLFVLKHQRDLPLWWKLNMVDFVGLFLSWLITCTSLGSHLLQGHHEEADPQEDHHQRRTGGDHSHRGHPCGTGQWDTRRHQGIRTGHHRGVHGVWRSSQISASLLGSQNSTDSFQWFCPGTRTWYFQYWDHDCPLSCVSTYMWHWSVSAKWLQCCERGQLWSGFLHCRWMLALLIPQIKRQLAVSLEILFIFAQELVPCTLHKIFTAVQLSSKRNHIPTGYLILAV